MSAKPSKKSAKKERVAPVTATASAAVPATGTVITAPVTASWIESSNPRKRTIGKIVLGGLWIYVAALWLLALDQTFHWGIFGPKALPLP